MALQLSMFVVQFTDCSKGELLVVSPAVVHSFPPLHTSSPSHYPCRPHPLTLNTRVPFLPHPAVPSSIVPAPRLTTGYPPFHSQLTTQGSLLPHFPRPQHLGLYPPYFPFLHRVDLSTFPLSFHYPLSFPSPSLPFHFLLPLSRYPCLLD